MKSSTKYLTGKSTYVTMGLVDGLINQCSHTPVVKNPTQRKEHATYSRQLERSEYLRASKPLYAANKKERSQMLRTWTDTHYKLEDDDWLYIATHEEQSSASLVCPGYARDGEGFSIHFTPAHLETLEHLLTALRIIQAQQEAMLEYTYPEPKATTHLIR
ncbi:MULTISPECIES: hypothetical protein [unclassified Microcoleus]|uniref:hypothetical protein n=2 Tax=Oscillatoriales TaxID=1150 RepID=UPI002FD49809